MVSWRSAAELPVLLLYNLDHSWAVEERAVQAREIELLRSSLEQLGHPVTLLEIAGSTLLERLADFPAENWIVMNLCEEIPGFPHSEAEAAMVLEKRNMTYTGAHPDTLSSCENKRLVKETLDAHGLPTPAWAIYERPWAGDWHRFPAIVKPAFEHCSLGITSESIVLNRHELERQIEHVLRCFNEPVIVEDFIDGREFHVSLIGNRSPWMLPPAEMDFSRCVDIHDRLCTYEAKFCPGSKQYEIISTIIPAVLTPAQRRELKRCCLRCYRLFGCRDYARLDIRLRDGVFYILDINPNPDISSDASTACAAEQIGLSYGELGSRLVRLAASRHPQFA